MWGASASGRPQDATRASEPTIIGAAASHISGSAAGPPTPPPSRAKAVAATPAGSHSSAAVLSTRLSPCRTRARPEIPLESYRGKPPCDDSRPGPVFQDIAQDHANHDPWNAGLGFGTHVEEDRVTFHVRVDADPETTEAFLDGHVSAFAFPGGVPRSILYDNTTLAVARIPGDGTRQRTRASRICNRNICSATASAGQATRQRTNIRTGPHRGGRSQLSATFERLAGPAHRHNG